MSLLLNANQFITEESEYYKYTLAINTHTVVVYLRRTMHSSKHKGRGNSLLGVHTTFPFFSVLQAALLQLLLAVDGMVLT